MIVKNEARSLGQCLHSVQGVVDEIIVLDTGSRDRTVEIAQQFGARIYHFTWCNDFSKARNAALKYVRGDWILVLDADEVLAPEIVPALKHAIQDARYLVINLLRHEIGAAQSPYSQVSRLFRNHPDISFSRPYHALVDDSVAAILTQETHWQIGYLPQVAILHTGYQKSAIASQDKLATAQVAMEGFLATHPHDAYVCSKLGALYVQTGALARGIELLERGLTSSSNAQILYELHYHLGIAYTRTAERKSAMVASRLRSLVEEHTAVGEASRREGIAHYQAAIANTIDPMLKLGAYNNLGNLYQATGDLTAAKIVYETALQIDPQFAAGHYNLGMTLKAMGLLSEAIAAYQKAIAINPEYAQAYQNLGVVLLKLGNMAASLAAFKQAINLHSQQNPAEAKRLHQGLIAMGFTI